MEEDIKILEKVDFIAFGKKEDIEALKRKFNVNSSNEIIETLINKYKELNDEALKQSEWLVEKQKKIEEQEKMIDFMIDWIRERSIYGVDSHEKLKDYFKKKVRDENENPR